MVGLLSSPILQLEKLSPGRGNALNCPVSITQKVEEPAFQEKTSGCLQKCKAAARMPPTSLRLRPCDCWNPKEPEWDSSPVLASCWPWTLIFMTLCLSFLCVYHNSHITELWGKVNYCVERTQNTVNGQ